jgi:hypothetical protein
MAKWFVDAAKALRKDVDGRERGNRNSYGRMADAKDEGLLGVVSAPSALRWRCAALRLRETMVDDGRSRAGEAQRTSKDFSTLEGNDWKESRGFGLSLLRQVKAGNSTAFAVGLPRVFQSSILRMSSIVACRP